MSFLENRTNPVLNKEEVADYKYMLLKIYNDLTITQRHILNGSKYVLKRLYKSTNLKSNLSKQKVAILGAGSWERNCIYYNRKQFGLWWVRRESQNRPYYTEKNKAYLPDLLLSQTGLAFLPQKNHSRFRYYHYSYTFRIFRKI